MAPFALVCWLYENQETGNRTEIMDMRLYRLTSLFRNGTVVFLASMLSLLLLFPMQSTYAADIDIDTASKTLTEIESLLKRQRYDEDKLKEFANQVSNIKASAATCVTDFETQQVDTQAALASLGEPTPKDSLDVTRKRRDIQKQLTNIEKQLGSCRVLVLHSEELHGKINNATKELLATRLLAQGPDFFDLLEENWNKREVWIAGSAKVIKRLGGLQNLLIWHWFILFVLLVLSIGPTMLLRKNLQVRIRSKQWAEDYSGYFTLAFVTTFVLYLPHLLGSTVAAIFFYILTRDLSPTPLIALLVEGLPFYFLIAAVVRLLFAPPPPATLFLAIPESLATALARRLRFLALLVYVGFLLFSTIIKLNLPEALFLLARDIYAAFLILNLIWAFALLMQLSTQKTVRWLTSVIHLSLTLALIAEWIGYRNLALGLAQGVLGSLLALGITLLLDRLFRELYSNLDYGRRPWNRRLRQTMGLKPGDTMPGLFWLRLITVITLWLLFGYVMLQVWDVSDTITLDIQTYLTQGFTIWSLEIIPARFASAVITIALILTIGGWFRKRMESTWLQHTRLDRGAREATVTITGYMIVTIAAITGLSIAGFNFQSIAIIAGALSVGIGFGLQNIVNNFISGLILLFERPIKTGDWIMVGNTEGYVKRIRIRSTEIQTFDRADVIVPNSELIASQVTNWMLHDSRGRARLPVGVAYGSDTQKVKTILEHVAEEHPRVVNDGSTPKPKVLFRGFGESSLDFELRCFIQDIDERLQVVSDLNFAIDAAFRENGIEIPFPQRDLHVRDLPHNKSTPSDDEPV
jgi:potassium efflux system protein